MPNLSIGRLNLILAGSSVQEGRQLTRLIAERLSAAPVPISAQGRNRLQANIRPRPGANMQELSRQIVADLLRQLNRS
jgi:hypothetical protein